MGGFGLSFLFCEPTLPSLPFFTAYLVADGHQISREKGSL